MISLSGIPGAVESLVIVEETRIMYDLTIADVYIFAVGEGQWVVHNRNCTWEEIQDEVGDRFFENYGNNHAYEWKLKSVDGPHDINSNNPDPIIGDGQRYYAVFYGMDERGVTRELRV